MLHINNLSTIDYSDLVTPSLLEVTKILELQEMKREAESNDQISKVSSSNRSTPTLLQKPDSTSEVYSLSNVKKEPDPDVEVEILEVKKVKKEFDVITIDDDDPVVDIKRKRFTEGCTVLHDHEKNCEKKIKTLEDRVNSLLKLCDQNKRPLTMEGILKNQPTQNQRNALTDDAQPNILPPASFSNELEETNCYFACIFCSQKFFHDLPSLQAHIKKEHYMKVVKLLQNTDKNGKEKLLEVWRHKNRNLELSQRANRLSPSISQTDKSDLKNHFKAERFKPYWNPQSSPGRVEQRSQTPRSSAGYEHRRLAKDCSSQPKDTWLRRHDRLSNPILPPPMDYSSEKVPCPVTNSPYPKLPSPCQLYTIPSPPPASPPPFIRILSPPPAISPPLLCAIPPPPPMSPPPLEPIHAVLPPPPMSPLMDIRIKIEIENPDYQKFHHIPICPSPSQPKMSFGKTNIAFKPKNKPASNSKPVEDEVSTPKDQAHQKEKTSQPLPELVVCSVCNQVFLDLESFKVHSEKHSDKESKIQSNNDPVITKEARLKRLLSIVEGHAKTTETNKTNETRKMMPTSPVIQSKEPKTSCDKQNRDENPISANSHLTSPPHKHSQEHFIVEKTTTQEKNNEHALRATTQQPVVDCTSDNGTNSSQFRSVSDEEEIPDFLLLTKGPEFAKNNSGMTEIFQESESDNSILANSFEQVKQADTETCQSQNNLNTLASDDNNESSSNKISVETNPENGPRAISKNVDIKDRENVKVKINRDPRIRNKNVGAIVIQQLESKVTKTTIDSEPKGEENIIKKSDQKFEGKPLSHPRPICDESRATNKKTSNEEDRSKNDIVEANVEGNADCSKMAKGANSSVEEIESNSSRFTDANKKFKAQKVWIPLNSIAQRASEQNKEKKLSGGQETSKIQQIPKLSSEESPELKHQQSPTNESKPDDNENVTTEGPQSLRVSLQEFKQISDVLTNSITQGVTTNSNDKLDQIKSKRSNKEQHFQKENEIKGHESSRTQDQYISTNPKRIENAKDVLPKQDTIKQNNSKMIQNLTNNVNCQTSKPISKNIKKDTECRSSKIVTQLTDCGIGSVNPLFPSDNVKPVNEKVASEANQLKDLEKPLEDHNSSKEMLSNHDKHKGGNNGSKCPKGTTTLNSNHNFASSKSNSSQKIKESNEVKGKINIPIASRVPDASSKSDPSLILKIKIPADLSKSNAVQTSNINNGKKEIVEDEANLRKASKRSSTDKRTNEKKQKCLHNVFNKSINKEKLESRISLEEEDPKGEPKTNEKAAAEGDNCKKDSILNDKGIQLFEELKRLRLEREKITARYDVVEVRFQGEETDKIQDLSKSQKPAKTLLTNEVKNDDVQTPIICCMKGKNGANWTISKLTSIATPKPTTQNVSEKFFKTDSKHSKSHGKPVQILFRKKGNKTERKQMENPDKLLDNSTKTNTKNSDKQTKEENLLSNHIKVSTKSDKNLIKGRKLEKKLSKHVTSKTKPIETNGKLLEDSINIDEVSSKSSEPPVQMDQTFVGASNSNGENISQEPVMSPKIESNLGSFIWKKRLLIDYHQQQNLVSQESIQIESTVSTTVSIPLTPLANQQLQGEPDSVQSVWNNSALQPPFKKDEIVPSKPVNKPVGLIVPSICPETTVEVTQLEKPVPSLIFIANPELEIIPMETQTQSEELGQQKGIAYSLTKVEATKIDQQQKALLRNYRKLAICAPNNSSSQAPPNYQMASTFSTMRYHPYLSPPSPMFMQPAAHHHSDQSTELKDRKQTKPLQQIPQHRPTRPILPRHSTKQIPLNHSIQNHIMQQMPPSQQMRKLPSKHNMQKHLPPPQMLVQHLPQQPPPLQQMSPIHNIPTHHEQQLQQHSPLHQMSPIPRHLLPQSMMQPCSPHERMTQQAMLELHSPHEQISQIQHIQQHLTMLQQHSPHELLMSPIQHHSQQSILQHHSPHRQMSPIQHVSHHHFEQPRIQQQSSQQMTPPPSTPPIPRLSPLGPYLLSPNPLTTHLNWEMSKDAFQPYIQPNNVPQESDKREGPYYKSAKQFILSDDPVVNTLGLAAR